VKGEPVAESVAVQETGGVGSAFVASWASPRLGTPPHQVEEIGSVGQAREYFPTVTSGFKGVDR
jgi:hypothetical protein